MTESGDPAIPFAQIGIGMGRGHFGYRLRRKQGDDLETVSELEGEEFGALDLENALNLAELRIAENERQIGKMVVSAG
jgi:hypothetical protein